jgi:Tol biopolymer transport system component
MLDTCWGLDWNPRSGEIWFTGKQGPQNLLWAVTTGGHRRTIDAFPEQLVLQSIQPGSDRCLLTSWQLRGVMMVRSDSSAARDMSWLGYTRITDLSPDRKRLLFFDRGPTARSTGAYIRPIEGGDAVKLSDSEPGRFSPDGRWVIGVTDNSPHQLSLFPVEAGASRLLKTPGLETTDPSFLDGDTILFVGAANGARHVWRIRTDGSGLSLVGAPDCDLPQLNPARDVFVCEGGPGNRAIFVYPLSGGPGRKLHEISGARRFWYARFNSRGDRIYAVANDREFVTLDAQTGKVLAQETLPPPLQEGYSELIDAVFDADAVTQAYSLNHYASHLYLAAGLR